MKAPTPLNAECSQAWRGGPSFSLGNRFYRLMWQISWLLFASWTPPQLRSWRRFLLRCFGANIDSTANVYGSAKIWSPNNLTMGPFSTIGPRTIIYSMATIEISSFAIVSQGAHLCAGSHDIEDHGFQLHAKPIFLGGRSWIAAEAFVGPGVVVGEGAVLGARGCAMRKLDSWTVYSGNPAMPIKKRNVRFD